MGEGQRERDTHRIWNRLQSLSCQHRAQRGAPTHELWDHDLSQSWMLNRLSHPGSPGKFGLIMFCLWFLCLCLWVGLAWNFSLKKFFLNIYLFLRDRERQSMSRGGAEREGGTESETGSRLWAVSAGPDAGLELTDREIMTWAEVGRLTDQATQAPPIQQFYTLYDVQHSQYFP